MDPRTPDEVSRCATCVAPREHAIPTSMRRIQQVSSRRLNARTLCAQGKGGGSSVGSLVCRRTLLGLVGMGSLLSSSAASSAYAADGKVEFRRIPTQFIAALGDPTASQGTGAESWGLWRVDPGPRGVYLRDYERALKSKGNVAPAGWTFDDNDWWVEEHGLIMEKPDFPLPDGRYLVTGDRQVTTMLTVENGAWKLYEGSLYDVTHLPCRSARYSGSDPTRANQRDFPVKPGAVMPSVEGAEKQDYAVLFVIGVEKTFDPRYGR